MSSYPQSSGTQPFRPPIAGSICPPQNFGSAMPVQFRPFVSPQQTHPFVPAVSQHFRPAGQNMPSSNSGMPTAASQIPQPSPPLPSIPLQPGQGPLPSQPIALPFIQPIRPISVTPLQPQQNTQVLSNNPPNFIGAGIPFSSSYTVVAPYNQPSNAITLSSQYNQIPQMQSAGAPHGLQACPVPASQSAPLCVPTMQQPFVQSSAVVPTVQANNAQSGAVHKVCDWQEHTSPDGKRYYYNKKTKQSTWEKPFELMTPTERADASTGWKECTASDGRKYYYHKITKQSKWIIPDELKLAREQAEKSIIEPAKSDLPTASCALSTTPGTVGMFSTVAVGSSTQTASAVVSSPPQNVPTDSSIPSQLVASGSSPVFDSTSIMPFNSSLETSKVVASTIETNLSTIEAAVTTLPASVPASSVETMDARTVKIDNNNATLSPTLNLTSCAAVATSSAEMIDVTTVNIDDNHEKLPSTAGKVLEGASRDLEDVRTDLPVAELVGVPSLEEKPVADEPVTYTNKQEAKDAFKALLDSSNVGSDWTWDQAMRVIINDKRYTAFKTLSERKQAFNEYLGQRRKLDVEEKRTKHKKARDDFIAMLEESTELRSSFRWSKAVILFDKDDRFHAIERSREKEDLFESYIEELQKKEKAKAAEEHRRNLVEYRVFLQSCDFIKANSQWRKVHDRLEEDERCFRLERIDRLKIFQDYVNDLEKEEEEQRKIEKERLRREERKNRDEFRRLMEEHVVAGLLTAKTQWRDYCMKVKDLPPFISVSSNTTGATPKDLFEDVAEELQKQYQEDKSQIKDALKIGKVTLKSSMSFEDFKAGLSEDDELRQISDVTIKFVFDELVERLREKEEKETKRRQHLSDEFSTLVHSIKEITASSRWEEFKPFFDEYKEYRSITEERFGREIFEDYVARLKEIEISWERKRNEEKARKEKEKQKEKRKDKKEREREREKTKGKGKSDKDETENDFVDLDGNSSREVRKKEKEKDRKYRKRHHEAQDAISSENEGKSVSKRSRRHTGDYKRSHKNSHGRESDIESRHRRHKRDKESSKHGAYGELEDGELGEDGEIH